MPYGEMTVGDLRKAIEDMPDDTTLVIMPSEQDFRSCEPSWRREKGEKIKIEGIPASVWNYNTRFVRNIHTANDDRLDNSSILVICIGEPLP